MKKQPIVNGRRLAELRCAAGLSQCELAEIVGVAVGTIGNVERGRYVPSLAVLVALAATLEVSLDSLVGREVVA